MLPSSFSADMAWTNLVLPRLFVGRSVHGNLGNGLPVMEATAKRQSGGDDSEHDDDAHDLILYLHISSW